MKQFCVESFKSAVKTAIEIGVFGILGYSAYQIIRGLGYCVSSLYGVIF